jgi:hypothetical protein
MCTCKCVYKLCLFILVPCMCLNQVCAAYLTVTQHFIFPISSVTTKAIFTASWSLLHADKLCLFSDQMILDYFSLLLSVRKRLNGPSQPSCCQKWQQFVCTCQGKFCGVIFFTCSLLSRHSQRACLPGITCPNVVGVVSRNHESLLSCLHRALIRYGDVYDSDVHTHTDVGSMLWSKECKV